MLFFAKKMYKKIYFLLKRHFFKLINFILDEIHFETWSLHEPLI